MVAAATIPPLLLVSPRSTAYAWRASRGAMVAAGSGTMAPQVASVRSHASAAVEGRSGRVMSDTSSSRSCRAPCGISRWATSPDSVRRASGAPVQRRCSGPDLAVQTPWSSCSAHRGWAPNPADASSTRRTRAGPSTAATWRSTTARWLSAGSASASRHSTSPRVLTQRLRQMSPPSS